MPEHPVGPDPSRQRRNAADPKRYFFTAFVLDKPPGTQTVTERRACSQVPGTTLSAMQCLPSRTPAKLGACALLVLLSIGLNSTALAQWKWRDGKGHVQYSDIPPPSTVAEQDILQRPNGAGRRAPVAAVEATAAAPAGSAASGPRTTDPDLEAKRKAEDEKQAAKRKAEEDKQAAARAENCRRAQAQQRALDDGMRIARVNAKGEREILDDKGRAEESSRARAIISSDCK